VGIGETLVLVYLLLASGDLFLQKLVRVMPTLSDKKRAVEISHEIQQNISRYLFSVSLINAGLGALVCGGLYFIGVPNAAMWACWWRVLNFVPYFGPVCGVILLAIVGLLTLTRCGRGSLRPGWGICCFIFWKRTSSLQFCSAAASRSTPVVIFVSLIFWTWLWGVPGALLSVPFLVSIRWFAIAFPRCPPSANCSPVEPHRPKCHERHPI